MTYQGSQTNSKQDVLLDTLVGTLPQDKGQAVMYSCSLWLRMRTGDTGTYTLSVGGQQIASSSAVPAAIAAASTSLETPNVFPSDHTDVPIEFEAQTGDKVKLDFVAGSTGDILDYRLDAD